MKRYLHRLGLPVMIAVMIPKALFADNLAGLVYLLFIWPAGLILCIAFIVQTIVLAVKRRKADDSRRPSVAAGVAAATIPPVLFGLFALLTLTNDNAMNWPDMAVMSVMPVLLPALAATVMGILYARDARTRA